MEPREIAIDFLRNNKEQINQVLGIRMFDVDQSIECICKFVHDNPVIADYYNPLTTNPRVTTALIAALYRELIPSNVREERRRIDYIARMSEQRINGKIPADLYNDFLGTYFSGTIDTNDLKRDGKIDFNSLALKRASGVLNR